MAKRRVAPGIGAVALTAAMTFLLSACGGTGYHYVKSSDFNTYFKVPDRWKLYDTEDILKVSGTDLSEKQKERVLATQWETAFDSNPSPSLAHILKRNGHPSGLAGVFPLSSDDSDAASDQVLRNFFLPIDEAANDNRLTIDRAEMINRDGGFHGMRLAGRLVVKNADPQNAYEDKAYGFDQLVMINQQRTHVYAVILACSAQCYEKNTGKMEGVVDSWTVKDN